MLKEKQLFARILLYIVGLLVLAFGTSFVVNANLGVTAVTSLPFVFSLITDINIGTVFTGMFIIFILLQIVLLRKEFKWINLTQIIFSAIFGYFVNLAEFIVGDFVLPTYFGQLVMLGIGIFLVSLGIVIYMEAKLVSLPPEGLDEAIAHKIPKCEFYQAKIGKDSIMVITSIALSFMFLGGLYGIREGTIIATILIGKLISIISKLIAPIVTKFISFKP